MIEKKQTDDLQAKKNISSVMYDNEHKEEKEVLRKKRNKGRKFVCLFFNA